jgi:NADPH-dependent F420 reductase
MEAPVVAELPTLGFLAGTGPLGQGLALRLALAGYEVLIGSRSAERADGIVEELLDGRDLPITGVSNAEAAERGEIVYLMFPWAGQAEALPPLAGAIGDKITVSTISPLAFGEHGPEVPELPDGSSAAEARRLLPRARLVSGFHDVAAGKLKAVEKPVETDILICGDDAEAKAVVIGHADAIEGVRGIDAGGLQLARELEGLTAVLVAVNKRYKVRAGVRMTGLSDERRMMA